MGRFVVLYDDCLGAVGRQSYDPIADDAGYPDAALGVEHQAIREGSLTEFGDDGFVGQVTGLINFKALRRRAKVSLTNNRLPSG